MIGQNIDRVRMAALRLNCSLEVGNPLTRTRQSHSLAFGMLLILICRDLIAHCLEIVEPLFAIAPTDHRWNDEPAEQHCVEYLGWRQLRRTVANGFQTCRVR